MKFAKTLLLCCFVILITCRNRARGMTVFTLHPCHLFPPTILASSSCTPPFPSASPRRADLLVFFPFRLLLWFVRFAQLMATLVAPRVASLFSLAASLLLPLHASPLLSSSLRLRSISPCLEMRFFFYSLPFLPALRSSPSSSPSELVQLLLLFSLSERDAKNDGRCAREE